MKNLKGLIFGTLLAILVVTNLIGGFMSTSGPSSAKTVSSSSSSGRDQACVDRGDCVALKPAPGNRVVQMFEDLSDGPNVKITTYGDGVRCIKLSDLIRYGDGYTAMYFYKLDCKGNIGYVNADWVR